MSMNFKYMVGRKIETLFDTVLWAHDYRQLGNIHGESLFFISLQAIYAINTLFKFKEYWRRCEFYRKCSSLYQKWRMKLKNDEVIRYVTNGKSKVGKENKIFKVANKVNLRNKEKHCHREIELLRWARSL